MVISKLKNVGAAGPLGELGCEGLRGHVWRLHDFRVCRFAAKKLNMSRLNVYITQTRYLLMRVKSVMGLTIW